MLILIRMQDYYNIALYNKFCSFAIRNTNFKENSYNEKVFSLCLSINTKLNLQRIIRAL